eukprot:TRINITY_DN7349_c0_g1_i1.p1 TRINITY_DN7349_c0_g1~~TRINITY_DN7349_c0_g1_i1.p1  ORF type:complete len:342 (-),score=105.29 TRINITY_DN7349_c0_g1_i1:38-1063(-)
MNVRHGTAAGLSDPDELLSENKLLCKFQPQLAEVAGLDQRECALRWLDEGIRIGRLALHGVGVNGTSAANRSLQAKCWVESSSENSRDGRAVSEACLEGQLQQAQEAQAASERQSAASLEQSTAVCEARCAELEGQLQQAQEAQAASERQSAASLEQSTAVCEARCAELEGQLQQAQEAQAASERQSAASLEQSTAVCEARCAELEGQLLELGSTLEQSSASSAALEAWCVELQGQLQQEVLEGRKALERSGERHWSICEELMAQVAKQEEQLKIARSAKNDADTLLAEALAELADTGKRLGQVEAEIDCLEKAKLDAQAWCAAIGEKTRNATFSENRPTE